MTTDNDPEGEIDPERRTTITAIGSLGIGLAGLVGMIDVADGRYGRDRGRSRGNERGRGRGGGCGKWCRGRGQGRERDRGRGYERDHPHYDDDTRWDDEGDGGWRDDERRRTRDGEETEDERSRDEDGREDEGDGQDGDGEEDAGDVQRDPTDPEEEGREESEEEESEGTEEREESGDGESEEPEEEEGEEPEGGDETESGEREEDDEQLQDGESEEREDQERRETDAGTAGVAGRIEARIHVEVNEYRAEQGLDALSFDEALADVARDHSRDMNDRDYFSHDAPDGSGPGDRLDAAGIDCGGWAENIAYEYDSRFSAEDADSVADSIVQGWIDSAGHRRNVLGDYGEQGVGVDVRDDGRVMATQLFCSR